MRWKYQWYNLHANTMNFQLVQIYLRIVDNYAPKENDADNDQKKTKYEPITS